ncbi:MAG: serine/threonine protein kinase [Comamonadaceae bacterium]|nr:MAG: serine/threonine protein kinase [Comamonadaceae bacterium]
MATVLTAALAGLGSVSALAQANTSLNVPAPVNEAGQKSTKTPSGVANPTQRPDGTNPASRAAVRSEAQAANRANAIPNGETSTLENKKPNGTPQTSEMTRGEVKQTAQHQKRPFGNTGERPAVPTNPTDSTGTPK